MSKFAMCKPTDLVTTVMILQTEKYVILSVEYIDFGFSEWYEVRYE